jgi:phage tail sheath gpL-like
MIVFNNIPASIRTPGVFTEVDNNRALKGLFPNPHKALLIGQKTSLGSKPSEVLYQMTSDGLADGFFGPGSQLAIMVNQFKKNNPNTELYAIALSDSGGSVKASGVIKFSVALSGNGFSMNGAGTYNLMIDGQKVPVALASGWSVADCNSAAITAITENDQLPVTGSTNAASALLITAKNGGSQGNFLDIRANYYTGEKDPAGFTNSAQITAMAGGSGDPSLDAVWAVVAGIQFHYIGQPYDGSSQLASLEAELTNRFLPQNDLQGSAFLVASRTVSGGSTLGNSRNSAMNSIMVENGSPSSPARWTAALAAVASYYLNDDPARPLHYLPLKGILPPVDSLKFSRTERDLLLWDGISTWIVDSSGNVCIERLITTYQTNPAGVPDPSYLDICTMATLSEIRYQYKARMLTRFIIPRFKLVDDTFPIQPNTNVVQPKTIKDEVISLFTQLRDRGLIENLDDFRKNLVVERNATDRNRVDVLLPPDLVNQFMVLGSIIQFIL